MRALERLHTMTMTTPCNSAHGTQLKMCSERVIKYSDTYKGSTELKAKKRKKGE